MFPNRKKPKSMVQKTAIYQYIDIANSAVGFRLPNKPKEGWVRTIRTALGMSGSQLGVMMGLSRNRISVLERREAAGDITLNQLQELAEKLNCDLTYALVPRKPIEDIIDDRATRVASIYLESNAQSMFLEAQSIDENAKTRLLNQIKKQIIENDGRDLWGNNKE